MKKGLPFLVQAHQDLLHQEEYQQGAPPDLDSSLQGAATFGLTPEFFSPSHFSDLEAHIKPAAQNLRWRYQRSLQEAWAQCLFCPQRLCQGSPWSPCTLSESIFGTSSLSSTCLLPQNSSWEAWHVPWYLRDGQLHPALHTRQRTEQLLVQTQEVLVPQEHTFSRRAGPTSMTLAISLPDYPAVWRLQVCPRESLPCPSNQQVGMLTWKAWVSSQETWTPRSDTQTIGREYSGET
ncbi:uncharacterized protein C22orf46 homolog isoform X1 [Heterocephalus glaber]|uniref:Uncharacterized protein C22orf46 homolog isoform X1 n=1 Tax=Heterocephalus glaber TaxID=10181 RepID=A0AAX6T3H3_HETGA|nr:uncharacterized protein C22orf46 homolog isoform X1 [Heterocephalus glaber]